MSAADFWRRMPISEKIRLAASVAEMASKLHGAADPATAKDAAEMRDLAAQMLESAAEDLRDPKRYLE